MSWKGSYKVRALGFHELEERSWTICGGRGRVFQQPCSLPGCSVDSREKGRDSGGMEITSQEGSVDTQVRVDKWGAGMMVRLGQVWNMLWNWNQWDLLVY